MISPTLTSDDAPAMDVAVPHAPREPSTPAGAEVFDAALALHRAGGDAGLLREVGLIFQREAPAWLAEIRAALEQRDGPAVERAAHRLKGAAGSLGAAATAAAALQLERQGRTGELEKAAGLFAALQLEVEKLQAALACWGAADAA